MWSIFFTAALAALATAAPYKRDFAYVVETVTDVVVVTQVITYTAGGIPASTTSTSAVVTSSVVTFTSPIVTSTSVAPSTAIVNLLANPPTVTPTTFIAISSATHTGRGRRRTSTAAPAPVVTTSIVVPVVTSTAAYSAPVVVPETTSSTVAPQVTTSDPPPAPTTTSVAPAVVTTSSTQAPLAQPTEYSQRVVAHHNAHRRNHSAPDIVWDTALANTAAKIAASCNYAHDTDTDKSTIGGYGQNIAAGITADSIAYVITDLFYNSEVNNYDGLYGQSQPDMSTFHGWGHFSQIVWHDTTKVGCATQQCNVLKGTPSNVPPIFTVCNYQGPGNVQGRYTQVGASLKLPTIHWDSPV